MLPKTCDGVIMLLFICLGMCFARVAARVHREWDGLALCKRMIDCAPCACLRRGSSSGVVGMLTGSIEC